MGKTPKKAAPGGDERNLYVRRLKATNMPSKTSETILPERQRESEMSNRPKVTGIHKKITPAAGKSFKSKLRSPTKLGLSHQSKRLSKLPGTSSQEKKLSVDKKIPPTSLNMQSETEDVDIKGNTLVQKDEIKKNDSKKDIDKADSENEQTVCNKEEVARIDVQQETTSSDAKPTQDTEEDKSLEKQTEVDGKEKESTSVSLQENTENEEHEENNIKLSFEPEENSVKSQEANRNEEEVKEVKEVKDDTKTEEIHVVQHETKPIPNEKGESQGEPSNDTESCSVDIVESTTSEVAETSEFRSPTNTAQKEKITKPEQSADNDSSFVSYDASIMLKEVQVKLNDCLKDNSKLFDTSNIEQSSPVLRDVSFGKALRNISGRRSIGRMRHVTIRERRFSPNNSLYVNTSTLSIPQDETTDCKVLRYSTGLTDNLPTNGSPVERKRKLEPEIWDTIKKQKTESENSLLNTSISLLKGLRRPIKVSTPNVDSYKCQGDKLNISDISNNDEILNEDSSTRKWCVLM